jgi:hypothetical protein
MAEMDIHAATRSYEAWVRRHISVRKKDLDLKHERMRESPFIFLRGTFYRWLQRWPEQCGPLCEAPRVLAVGDLHIENFGTWRDAEGRLIWGVNDVDEACHLPYTHDLVRLASSTLLAIEVDHFTTISPKSACTAILDGYQASLESRGAPVVLAERRRWLRHIAINRLRDPTLFWEKLTGLPTATGHVPARTLRKVMPAGSGAPRIVRRIAGVGSLGRQRFVALAEHRGGWIAREAKSWVPSAAVWLRGRTGHTKDNVTILRRGVRAVDPFFCVLDGLIVRRLAPDCSGIDIETIPDDRDELKLLRAMGWETANLHLGTGRDQILKDLKRRPANWLVKSAGRMTETVFRDWRDWGR